MDKAKRTDKYASKFEKDYLKRPGYLDGFANTARNDLAAHKAALAGRPDNGRYSRKTTADIKEEHNKKITGTVFI